MPVSTHIQISTILDEAIKLNPRTILDVGCGLGIYGALCRVYLEGDNLYDKANLTWNSRENWKIKIDCIEGFEKYITDLHRSVYNEIRIGEALDVISRIGTGSYDLVIAIDILEHFAKDQGTTFLRELRRVGRDVIIATPAEFSDQKVPENPLEDHRSQWSCNDLQALDFNIVKEYPSLIGLYHHSDLEAVPAGSGDVVVRLYREGDEQGILNLFKEIFNREMSFAEWQWKYVIGKPGVYASLALDNKGNIVAHYGGMPQRVMYRGKEIRGMAIGDVMVHPSCRGTKLFKKIAELLPDASAPDGFMLGYGFPTERAMRLPEILGVYEKVEDVWESVKEAKKISNGVRFIYKLFPLNFDDSRIDTLWDSLKDRFNLAVIRNRTYLQWRYKENPLFTYELWGIRRRWQQKLTGFVVVRRDGDDLLLIDFLCPLDQLAALFQKIENYAVASGCKRLRLWHPEYLNERLNRAGFTVGKSGTCIPRTTHPAWLKKDEIKGRFFYTMGDTDFL